MGHASNAWPEDLRRASAFVKHNLKAGRIRKGQLSIADLEDFNIAEPDAPQDQHGDSIGSRIVRRHRSDDDHLEALSWFCAIGRDVPETDKPLSSKLNNRRMRLQGAIKVRLSEPQPSWHWVSLAMAKATPRPPSASTVRRWYDEALSQAVVERLRNELGVGDYADNRK